MSFLGSVGSFIGGAVNKVVSTVTSPKKLTTAIVTGGASVVAPKTFAPLTNAIGSTLYNPQTLALATSKINPVAGLSNFLPSIPTAGSPKMALDLGGILNTVGNIFGGNQNPIFQGISNVSSLASQFVPQQTMARVPSVVAPAIGRTAIVGRSFFNKFPNLATAIQGLRNMGKNVTRKQLYSMLRRFGPELLISGGILTAAAVSELMVAGPGTRRMNPGNVKALRRSLRRLESFHHLCQRADKLRRPRGRRSGRGSGSTQQFVRQG